MGGKQSSGTVHGCKAADQGMWHHQFLKFQRERTERYMKLYMLTPGSETLIFSTHPSQLCHFAEFVQVWSEAWQIQLRSGVQDEITWKLTESKQYNTRQAQPIMHNSWVRVVQTSVKLSGQPGRLRNASFSAG
jgi:hypothetical protein